MGGVVGAKSSVGLGEDLVGLEDALPPSFEFKLAVRYTDYGGNGFEGWARYEFSPVIRHAEVKETGCRGLT